MWLVAPERVELGTAWRRVTMATRRRIAAARASSIAWRGARAAGDRKRPWSRCPRAAVAELHIRARARRRAVRG